MHKLIRTVALLTFTGALFAQNPFTGTWKLDTAKTKYTTGEPPKDLTLTIEEQGDNIQVSGTGTNSDGSPLSVKYSVPLKGVRGRCRRARMMPSVQNALARTCVRTAIPRTGKKWRRAA